MARGSTPATTRAKRDHGMTLMVLVWLVGIGAAAWWMTDGLSPLRSILEAIGPKR